MLKLLAILLLFSLPALAQERPPFWDEIRNYKKQDSIKFPPKKPILFIGSSSIVMWENVQEDFPGYNIINRGFGGSGLEHLIYYAKDIVFPYKPKQVLVYSGENDLASSDTVTSKMVFDRFRKAFSLIRSKLPGVPIIYVSMKPSPSRAYLMPKMSAANRMIRDYLKKQKKAVYVDVYSRMLDKNGIPLKDLFLGDELHMNENGYRLWREMIKPYLIR